MKKITFQELETLQERHGSPYHLADQWIEGALDPATLKKIEGFLDVAEEDLEETWISIFQALDTIGAVTPEKEVDFKSMRMFFLGVLGWMPSALRGATLPELADAFEGYRRYYNLSPAALSVPATYFMTEMMQKFPDETEAACRAA